MKDYATFFTKLYAGAEHLLTKYTNDILSDESITAKEPSLRSIIRSITSALKICKRAVISKDTMYDSLRDDIRIEGQVNNTYAQLAIEDFMHHLEQQYRETNI